MDGLWSSQGNSETLNQAELVRHRILTFNISLGFRNARDQSSFGSINPQTGLLPTDFPEGGPHFIMSPRAPEDSKSYGFEFTFLTLNSPDFMVSATGGLRTGPFSITVWEMIGNTQINGGVFQPQWASLLPVTVNCNELFHSFDVDATALRFQVGGAVIPIATAVAGSTMVAFSEL